MAFTVGFQYALNEDSLLTYSFIIRFIKVSKSTVALSAEKCALNR